MEPVVSGFGKVPRMGDFVRAHAHAEPTASFESWIQEGMAYGEAKRADWNAVYEEHAHIPNVARFTEQAEGLKTLLATAPPSEGQQKELGFLLTLGELFTLVVYGQLILEQAAPTGQSDDLVDAIFDVMVRDFSAYAVTLHGHPSTTAAQRAWVLENVREPVASSDAVWEQVEALSGALCEGGPPMNPMIPK